VQNPLRNRLKGKIIVIRMIEKNNSPFFWPLACQKLQYRHQVIMPIPRSATLPRNHFRKNRPARRDPPSTAFAASLLERCEHHSSVA
jgi:hypothetical protein